MITQQPIVDRLATEGVPGVEGALEFAGLQQRPGRLPARYVVPEEESAGDSRNVGVIDQRVAAGFMVVIVLDAAARSAKRLNDELERDVARVTDALLGWTHPSACTPTTYGGGRLLSADGQTLTWAIRFRSAYHLRKRDR